MELKVTPRAKQKSSETKVIRRAGNIPAILYSQGKPGSNLTVAGGEFRKALNTMKQGSLPTLVFYLISEGKRIPAIVKDIQYNVTTYDVMHLDFMELIENSPVELNAPIECVGAVDCPGVKLGGILRQVIRHVKVRIKSPKHIPQCINVDAREMGINDAKTLADITFPEGVTPIMPLNTIAVQIVKK